METTPRTSQAYEYAEGGEQLAERDMAPDQRARFQQLMHKPAHELKEMLDKNNIPYKDCTEKHEYAKKVLENVKEAPADK
ncbi:hypothetical protein HK097_000234 [Rhizophlyctis rosea]|uniref:Uncharacterized protein n=1 Tax=Rhizophlyctis rosea TaxID=64517 RepID=A0AAD5X263_9FUNG|nr:hypothetical protein HK097_000234 [Rhizophlyctis rosea]